jgi:hypothetical protein
MAGVTQETQVQGPAGLTFSLAPPPLVDHEAFFVFLLRKHFITKKIHLGALSLLHLFMM